MSTVDAPPPPKAPFWGVEVADKPPPRVLVCGGRTYGWARDKRTRELLPQSLKERQKLTTELNKIYRENFGFECVISGMANGADILAAKWAEYSGIPLLKYPVTQEEWSRLGPRAGPLRNQRMLTEGKPNLGIAFPGGNGTADMVRRLVAAGVRVIEIK
jgi:hypothetical protein